MLNFHEDAKKRKPACDCRRVQKELFKAGIPKKRGNTDNTTDVIITTDALATTLTPQRIYQILRCHCDICRPGTTCTRPEEDEARAKILSEKPEWRELIAALAFTGGTFALRLLYTRRLDSIEATLNHMRDRDDIYDQLFRAFDRHRVFATCQHEVRHIATQNLQCLGEDFLRQLRSWSTYLKVPSFQADNLLLSFHEEQNMPFINDTKLKIGLRGGVRSFYRFEICDSFCDAMLKNRVLFRKQIKLLDEEARQQATQEKDVLQILKELGHPNIAEILFAFTEELPTPRLSLVFYFHELDLRQVLSLGEQGVIEAGLHWPVPDKAEEKFSGSILNNWLWTGLLDIFDAVSAIHEPALRCLQHDDRFEWLGAHFDIKPANILVTSKGRFLLTDFGLAFLKRFDVEREMETSFTVTAGTSMYAPPPSYSPRRPQATPGPIDGVWWKRSYDIWSLACVATELLAYLVDPEDDPVKFQTERIKEDYAGFWEHGQNNKEILKPAVSRRLAIYRDYENDTYLNRVAEQVQRMFQMPPENSITVKSCQTELSVGARIDRNILQDPKDEEVAGPSTYCHLRVLRTSFSTPRVSCPLRCCLYLRRDTESTKYKLDIEFIGSERETFIVSNSTNVDDECLARALFNPELLYDRTRLRANGPFLECAFRSMHDGFVFHFAKRLDYYHFLGAMTHQYVEVGSEFRFQQCRIKARKNGFFRLGSETWQATSGHMHIWRQLEDEHYRLVYIDPYTRNVPTAQLESLSSASSRGSSDTSSARSVRSAKPVVLYRLVLYLCGNDNANHMMVIVSLNHDGFLAMFDHSNASGPCLKLDKRPSRVFRGTILGAPQESTNRSYRTPTSWPGIPLNHRTLTNTIETSEELECVNINFYDTDDSRRFETYYRALRGEEVGGNRLAP